MTDFASLNVDFDRLNSLYAAGEDPWHLRKGWYQQRKRAMLMASLPRARYDSVFEPACADGALTRELARRSEALLAADPDRDSVAATREVTDHLSNVDVQRIGFDEWPAWRMFDLIVLNEIGYGMTVAAWAQMAGAVTERLTEDATVVACHWRHDFPGRTLETETLHGLLDSVMGLPKQLHLSDADFTLDVWTTRSTDVAESEGYRRI